MLRHLEFERNDTSLNNLEKFLKEVNGKGYAFRPRQLMKRDTVILKRGDQPSDKIIEDDRTFFCSELVAKCYKVCNIM